MKLNVGNAGQQMAGVWVVLGSRIIHTYVIAAVVEAMA